MTLGEKISTQRILHQLSQADLAEKMNVSRQSVSKWETNASVPELDKLLQLSELFHLSLDELVKGDPLPESTEGEMPKQPEPPSSMSVGCRSFRMQKALGMLFLGIALLCFIPALFLSDNWLLYSGYFAFCGLTCLLAGKYAGLILAWGTTLLLLFFSARITGFDMFAVFSPEFYQPGISAWQLLLLVPWLGICILLAVTIRIMVRSFSKQPALRKPKHSI